MESPISSSAAANQQVVAAKQRFANQGTGNSMGDGVHYLRLKPVRCS
jgi:hypothetical protein